MFRTYTERCNSLPHSTLLPTNHLESAVSLSRWWKYITRIQYYLDLHLSVDLWEIVTPCLHAFFSNFTREDQMGNADSAANPTPCAKLYEVHSQVSFQMAGIAYCKQCVLHSSALFDISEPSFGFPGLCIFPKHFSVFASYPWIHTNHSSFLQELLTDSGTL